MIGLQNDVLGEMNRVHPSDFLRTAAKDWKRQDETKNGHRITTYEQVKVGEYKQKIVFSSQFNHSPILFELVANDNSICVSTTITPALISDKYWYPSKIVHLSVQGGKEYTKEILDLSDVNFGQPIKPEIFTLAGIGLQDEQAIAFPESKSADDFKIWKNGRIDPNLNLKTVVQSRLDNEKSAIPSEGESSRPNAPYKSTFTTFTVSAITLAIIAMLWVVRTIVKSKRPNK